MNVLQTGTQCIRICCKWRPFDEHRRGGGDRPQRPLGLRIRYWVDKLFSSDMFLKWVSLFAQNNKNIATRYVPETFGFGLIISVSQNTPEMTMPAAVAEHQST